MRAFSGDEYMRLRKQLKAGYRRSPDTDGQRIQNLPACGKRFDLLEWTGTPLLWFSLCVEPNVRDDRRFFRISFAFFSALYRYTIKEIAGLFGVSRGAYYKWLKTGCPIQDSNSDAELVELIREIVLKYQRRYGILRVRKELWIKNGINLSHKKVVRLMREQGLNARRRRKYTESRVLCWKTGSKMGIWYNVCAYSKRLDIFNSGAWFIWPKNNRLGVKRQFRCRSHNNSRIWNGSKES